MEHKIDVEYTIQTNVNQYKKTTGKILIEKILQKVNKQGGVKNAR